MKYIRLNILLLIILIILFSALLALTLVEERFQDFSIQIPQIENHGKYDIVTLKSRQIPLLNSKDKKLQYGDDIVIKDQFFFYPKTGYITEITSEVIGAPSHEVFHHAVVLSVLKGKDIYCPNYKELFFASGEELTVFKAPEGYGYPIQFPQQFFYLYTHIRNDLNSDFENVHFQYKFKIVKTNNLKPLNVLRIDNAPNPCDKFSSYQIPPNSAVTTQMNNPILSPYNGKIVLSDVHFHDFAKEATVTINGQDAMNFKAILTNNLHKNSDSLSSTHIESIPPQYPINLDIKKGDKINLLTPYNNPNDQPIEAMGFGFLYISQE